MRSELDKACLGCQLPICDDKAAECAFVQIKRLAPLTKRESTKRRIRRERMRAALAKRPKRSLQLKRDEELMAGVIAVLRKLEIIG